MEKHNRRLTAALTLMAVAMCAVVTVAATGEKIGRFDAVVVRAIFVKNDANVPVVVLGATDDGDGFVTTNSTQGKELVVLGATDLGVGGDTIMTYQPNGKGRTLKPGP